ncbi:hypothetical protein JCM3774_005393 [Rhodotorula dairenensis]
MLSEGDEQPVLGAFSSADEFLAGAQELIDLDLHASPAEDATERDEQRQVEQLCILLDEYQEQPYLLDPSLECMVSPLVGALRDTLQADKLSAGSRRLGRLAKLLYWLTKVRGPKTVVRFFPHEVGDLSFLLALLSEPLDAQSAASASDSGDIARTATSWELRYLLLLWLSVCIRLPFPFRLLAPGAEESIRSVGLRWLRASGKESDAAALVVGRYYCRDDVDLEPLLDLCESTLTARTDDLMLLPLLGALAIVLSCSGPNKIYPTLPRLYGLIALLPEANNRQTGAALAKLRAKIAGRIGLAHLKALNDTAAADVPEEVEVIVSELIEGLAHPDSIPRYTSAKYLARISLQSPPELAIQVVDTVLADFEQALLDDAQKSGEGRVQGTCLAIGEMARCAVLARLPEAEKSAVVKRVLSSTLQALRYDHLTALHVVGASVRDSAAYVLWSLARTMSASFITAAEAQNLAAHLLCTACLDREVSVRRAASAAWQEAVGRWGIFAHGIASLRATDFYTASVRHRAYLQGAVEIAAFDEYRPAILAHLTGESAAGPADTGVAHYDAEIRTLSAKALGKIAEHKAGAVVSDLIQQQLARLSGVTKAGNKLEGVLLALASLAEATAALADPEDQERLRSQIFVAVCSLHPTTRSLRSQRAVFEAGMYALAASAPRTSHSAREVNWFDLVHLACDRTEATAHQAASAALSCIARSYNCASALTSLLADLDSRSGGRQEAAIELIGSIGFDQPSVSARAEAVIARVCTFVQREGRAAAGTIEARRTGVAALGRILKPCLGGNRPPLDPILADAAFEALLLGFSDFSSDSRGDVGSWVRIATVTAWSRITRSARLPTRVLHRALAGIARLALERLDSVRTVAGEALSELAKSKGPNVDVLTELRFLCDTNDVEPSDWRDIEWATTRVLPLLRSTHYRAEVLEGAICSNVRQCKISFACAGLAADSRKRLAHADSVLYKYFPLREFLGSLLALAKARFGNNRVFVPFLFTLAQLAEAGSLDAAANDADFAQPLQELLRVSCSALEKTRSRARLSATSRVLAAFLALPVVAADAAGRVPIFLRHSQPWLRTQTAEHVFNTVSAFFPPDDEQELETLLTETDCAPT